MQTTIVVLDANEAVRRALGRVLQKKNFIVRTFSRTKQFLDYLNSTTVDVAVVDCDLLEIGLLPGRNGQASQAKPRLVLTTASPARQQTLKETYPGLPVLLKPFGAQELLTFILKANEQP
jgi:DNA-binding response OmpR family regulator